MFNSYFLFILLLLVSIIWMSSLSPRLAYGVAGVYLGGTTRSGVTQVSGLYLLVLIQTAFKTQMPASKAHLQHM